MDARPCACPKAPQYESPIAPTHKNTKTRKALRPTLLAPSWPHSPQPRARHLRYSGCLRMARTTQPKGNSSHQFHPAVSSWFEHRFGEATEPPELGWPAIQKYENVLIAAPTSFATGAPPFLKIWSEPRDDFQWESRRACGNWLPQDWPRPMALTVCTS